MRTPKGVAIWPQLNTPGKKYNKYEAKLRLDADDPEVQAFKAKLEQMRDEFYEAEVARLMGEKKAAVAKQLTKADVLIPELDQETGEETGYLILKATMTASGVVQNGPRKGQPWSQKPDIFDAKGKRLLNPPLIYGGSELKLSIEARPYAKPSDKTVGVSKDLRAVQIIKLVTGGQRGFSEYGFGEEDGDEIEDRPLEQAAPPAGAVDDDGDL